MFFPLHWWSRSTVSSADIRFSYIVWFLTLLSILSLSSWVLVDFLVCFVAASLSVAAVVGAPVTLHQRCLHTILTMFFKIFNFFLIIWHIQVRPKQIAAVVNGIYKCDYLAAFVFLDLQMRVDQMRL